MSDVTVIGDRAITLREAAQLLRVSYGTVYARREELGFFQIGSVWRIWPDRLRKSLEEYNKRRPAQSEQEDQPCHSTSAKAPTSGTLTSARQAAAALDNLLAQPTGGLRRNTTTS